MKTQILSTTAIAGLSGAALFSGIPELGAIGLIFAMCAAMSIADIHRQLKTKHKC